MEKFGIKVNNLSNLTATDLQALLSKNGIIFYETKKLSDKKLTSIMKKIGELQDWQTQNSPNSFVDKNNNFLIHLTNNDFLGNSRLSVHKDKEIRYHLVLKTNNNSYICQHINASQNSLNPIAVCYHIPKDGNWYKVDTKRNHWVYNGGNEERIHLVVCTF
jgi:hypothetical protein